MAYTPTEWVSGTIISASKLNNIERGIESVNSEYTPTTWAEGDTVTAAKLNKIEQGIADASGGGSSDFSTAEVTIVNDTVHNLYVPCYYNDGSHVVAPPGGSFYVVLYKGVAYAEISGGEAVATGAIEVDNLNLTITGDGTITILLGR